MFDIPTVGVFVDVGAGDGVHGSNTFYFESLGWHGLVVDADPRNREPLHRRRCAVETCAVSATPGERPFGMYAHKPSWSGLGRRGDDYPEVLVNCRPLGELLEQWHIDDIDLLSIDVEGTETDVWDSFDDSRHRPAIVILEFDDDHPERHRQALHAHLGCDQYEVVFETPANLIFERFDRRWNRRG